MNDQNLVDRSDSDRPSYEKVISSISNEFNDLEDSKKSDPVIQTGTSTTFRFQQETNSLSEFEELDLFE